MSGDDFSFIKYDAEYEDYWFKVGGDSEKELTKMYMEQSMVGVTEVVYSVVEDFLGVKLLFPFSYRVIQVDNAELKPILLVNIKKVVNERSS